MAAVYPFFAAHFRAADAPRFCCTDDHITALFGGTAAPSAVPEDLQPFLVKDRTPGFYLCEKHTNMGIERLLAARLEQGDAALSFRLPEVLCTHIIPQTGKNAVFVPEVLDRLSACTKPSVVFEADDALYTAKPIHDPVACRTLTEAMEGCTLEPIGTDALPPDGTAVLIRFEKAAGRFAAGLVLDMP